MAGKTLLKWCALNIRQKKMMARHEAEKRSCIENLTALRETVLAGKTTGEPALDFGLANCLDDRSDLRVFESIAMAKRFLEEMVQKIKAATGEYAYFDMWDTDSRKGRAFCLVVPPTVPIINPIEGTLALSCQRYVEVGTKFEVLETTDGPFTVPKEFFVSCVVGYRRFVPTMERRPTRDVSGRYLGCEMGDKYVEQCLSEYAWMQFGDNKDRILGLSVKLAQSLGRDPATVAPIQQRYQEARERGLFANMTASQAT